MAAYPCEDSPQTEEGRSAEAGHAQEGAARQEGCGPRDGFFAKQPPHLRVALDALRKLVEDAALDATASLKWGMPFYTVGREMLCGLAGSSRT